MDRYSISYKDTKSKSPFIRGYNVESAESFADAEKQFHEKHEGCIIIAMHKAN
jgi:DNA polymerase III epsilon subunit-like protein